MEIYLKRKLTFWLSFKILQNCLSLVDFIQNFSKLITFFILILKTVKSFKMPALNEITASRNEVIN